MGISGVNLAVAETGSICLVTNEGNGRLTTTLPRVHVALMGLERIVPTAADLGGSADRAGAQRDRPGLTGLHQHDHGTAAGRVRAGGEAGPRTGRPGASCTSSSSTTAGAGCSAAPLAEMLYCIRCGACLNVCPVYRAIGGHAYGGVYPGPIGSVVMPGLHGVEGWSELAHASSLCGACRDVCPVKIDLPHLLLAVSGRPLRRTWRPWWLRTAMPLYAAVATRPLLYRWAGRAAARMAGAVQREGWIRRLPGPLAAWTASRDFPAPASRSFVDAHIAAEGGCEMTSPRERILASIREGLLRAHLPALPAAPPASPEQPADAAGVRELREQFSAVLAALSGHVHPRIRRGRRRRRHRRPRARPAVGRRSSAGTRSISDARVCWPRWRRAGCRASPVT